MLKHIVWNKTVSSTQYLSTLNNVALDDDRCFVGVFSTRSTSNDIVNKFEHYANNCRLNTVLWGLQKTGKYFMQTINFDTPMSRKHSLYTLMGKDFTQDVNSFENLIENLYALKDRVEYVKADNVCYKVYFQDIPYSKQVLLDNNVVGRVGEELKLFIAKKTYNIT